jgi:sugar lactone lactonase YvrE
MWSKRVVLVCLLLTVSCAGELKRQPPEGYQGADCPLSITYAFSFGSTGRLPGQFMSPSSVSLDSFGNVLIADTGNNRIQKFDSSGRFILEFGALGSSSGELNGPTDAVENSLSIYVVDSMNERVLEYDLEGNFLSTCLSEDVLSDSRHSFGPRKLAFSPAGYVFLTDVEADAVMVLSKFWEPISVVGGFGGGEGRFSDPLGVALGEAEEVLVCDSGNRRVQRLDSLGNLAGILGVCSEDSFCEPVDAATGPDGTLYVADRTGRRVLVVTAEGAVICELPGRDAPALTSPSAVAVSPRGLLYVVDGGADVVHAFKLDDTSAETNVR